MLVDKQVDVCLKIDKNENVEMPACHLLFGMPW